MAVRKAKIVSILCTAFLSACESPHAEDSSVLDTATVDNGGDSVICAPDPTVRSENPDNYFEGVYSLDYLLTDDPIRRNQDIVELDSWEAYSERFERLIRQKAPDLYDNFHEFNQLLWNHSDLRKPRVWNASAHGLVNLNDESIGRRLPRNCYEGSLRDGDIRIRQAAVRRKLPSKIFYDYDLPMIEELKANPLQLSFLLMHEWLWDFTRDPWINRRVNRFLHSSQLDDDEYTRDEVEAILEGFGIAGARQIRLVEGRYGARELPNTDFRDCQFLDVTPQYDTSGKLYQIAGNAERCRRSFESDECTQTRCFFEDGLENIGVRCLARLAVRGENSFTIEYLNPLAVTQPCTPRVDPVQYRLIDSDP